MNTWLIRRSVRRPPVLPDHLGHQLVGVQAALHQGLGLARAHDLDRLGGGRVAVRRIDQPVRPRCRGRTARRRRGSWPAGPTRIGRIRSASAASTAAVERGLDRRDGRPPWSPARARRSARSAPDRPDTRAPACCGGAMSIGSLLLSSFRPRLRLRRAGAALLLAPAPLAPASRPRISLDPGKHGLALRRDLAVRVADRAARCPRPRAAPPRSAACAAERPARAPGRSAA